MMRDSEATIGKLIDKQSVAFISSVDQDGFPNTKAMLPPRKRVEYIHFTLPRIHLPCEWHSTVRIPRLAFIFVINAISAE